MYSIDQGVDGIPANSTAVHGSSLKFTIDAIHGSYEGTVSADSATIEGTWTQGRPLPLELRRATKETAWQRDPAPHTIQFVTVDNNVKLEVLDFGGSGRPLVLLTGLGNNAPVFDKFAPKLISSCHVTPSRGAALAPPALLRRSPPTTRPIGSATMSWQSSMFSRSTGRCWPGTPLPVRS